LFQFWIVASIYRGSNSRDVRNERSRDSVRFRPSRLVPLSRFLIVVGYRSSVIFSPLMDIDSPVNSFFGCSLGFVFSWNFRDCFSSSSASFGCELGRKFRISVILLGSASGILKSSISEIFKGMEASAVFSWSEYGARNRCRGETRITSIASFVEWIVISSLKFFSFFGCVIPP